MGGWVSGQIDGWVVGRTDGWMDGWNGMETLFNHGNFIKFYTYMSIYIKSALPKSRASITFAKYH